jgi:crossover junction endodeoxyribonuclease RusA
MNPKLVPMRAALTITLSLPPKELSPNARVHWSKRSKLVKRCRMASFIVGRGIKPPKPFERASIQYTFYWPDKRSHDDDNAVASCKAYRDGLADAGIVADDAKFTTLPAVMRYDKTNPRLEIEVTEVPS